VFEKEDCGAVPRVLAYAYFAFAVEVPVRCGERFDYFRVGLLESIKDVVVGNDV